MSNLAFVEFLSLSVFLCACVPVNERVCTCVSAWECLPNTLLSLLAAVRPNQLADVISITFCKQACKAQAGSLEKQAADIIPLILMIMTMLTSISVMQLSPSLNIISVFWAFQKLGKGKMTTILVAGWAYDCFFLCMGLH